MCNGRRGQVFILDEYSALMELWEGRVAGKLFYFDQLKNSQFRNSGIVDLGIEGQKSKKWAVGTIQRDRCKYRL